MLDWLELPDSAEADGVLIVSTDGTYVLPEICYCYEIDTPTPRFDYWSTIGGVPDLEYQLGSLRYVSGEETAISLKDPETGRIDEWKLTPFTAADGTRQFEMGFDRTSG